MSAPDLSSPTPASERSVYFDAPIMHIFSRNKPDDKPVITNADDDTPVPAAAHTGNPQSSVAIPPEPIANGHHDVEHDATPEPDEHNFAGTDTTPPSDSGYGLPSPTSPTRTGTRAPQRSASRASRASLKSMPVVWTDGEPAHADDETHHDSGADRRARRAASVRSTRSSASRRDRDDRESIRSTAASRFSERRRASLSGGSFAAGAGSIGPGSTPRPDETEEFDLRARNAEADLSPKQKSKIEKASAKEGKRLSKVLKSEAKSEAKAIDQSIRELADLQKMQKNALKEEARSVAAHTKALRAYHKEELEYLAARGRYEKAQAELAVVEDAREAARGHAMEITEMMQEKSQEVEWLRSQKAADDRERSAKLVQLTGKA